jgi:sister chromatid cohesion protein PDS5
VRSKAVELIGELISLPGVPILESFQPLFSEFLKRLTDRVVDLRISVIEHLKNCLISHPSCPEASQITRTFLSSFNFIAYEKKLVGHFNSMWPMSDS